MASIKTNWQANEIKEEEEEEIREIRQKLRRTNFAHTPIKVDSILGRSTATLKFTIEQLGCHKIRSRARKFRACPHTCIGVCGMCVQMSILQIRMIFVNMRNQKQRWRRKHTHTHTHTNDYEVRKKLFPNSELPFVLLSFFLFKDSDPLETQA